MKGSEHFKKAIALKLNEMAARDASFYVKYHNEKKNLDDCVTYILNEVKKSGINGFTEDEIYGMAMHYYDEEHVEVGSPIQGHVVVNHHVELTEEEKAEAKKRAMDLAIAEEKRKLTSKPKVESKPAEVVQQSLF